MVRSKLSCAAAEKEEEERKKTVKTARLDLGTAFPLKIRFRYSIPGEKKGNNRIRVGAANCMMTEGRFQLPAGDRWGPGDMLPCRIHLSVVAALRLPLTEGRFVCLRRTQE